MNFARIFFLLFIVFLHTTFAQPLKVEWNGLASIDAYGEILGFAKKGNIMIAAHESMGILQSTNNGDTWQRTSFRLPILAFVQNNNTLIVYAEDGYMWWSKDHGETWKKSSMIITARASRVAAGDSLGIAIPVNNYTGLDSTLSEWYVSPYPVGQLWTLIPNKLLPQRVSQVTVIGNTLLSLANDSTGAQIYSSRDRGVSWKKQGRSSMYVSQMFTHNSLIYILASTRIVGFSTDTHILLSSNDTCKTWKEISLPLQRPFELPYPMPSTVQRGTSGLPLTIDNYYTTIRAIGFDENNTMFISTTDDVLYKTSNRGSSWQQVSSYLWKAHAYITKSLFIRDSVVFIGGRKGDIYRCRENGENFDWVNVSDIYLYNNFWFTPYKNTISPLRNDERINARILFIGGTDIPVCESSKPHQDSQTRMSVPLKPKEIWHFIL